MVNQGLAKIFYEISLYLEINNEHFHSLAYKKAAQTIESLSEDITEIYKKGGLKELEKLAGIGKSLAFHIEEYIKTGKIKQYEILKKKIPVNISELTAIEGIGPKIIKKLYSALKIKNIADLEKAIRQGKIRRLKGFGKKTEQKILKSVEFLKSIGGRFTLGEISPIARNLEKQLKKLKSVKQVAICGSLRRKKETIGNLDILVSSQEPETAINFFIKLPLIAHIYAKGKTKASVRLTNNLDADLRVVPKNSFGAAMQYFTGNKEHNITMRKIAVKKGYKLNEYGLYKGAKIIAGKSEEEIYKKLGLKYIPPEIRENKNEIEAARKNRLPSLIKYGDLKGDLQIQTNWSDGANTIEEMAKAAMILKLEYIVITDHTKSLTIAGGLNEKQILDQIRYIKNLNLKLKRQGLKFRIFAGAEVNIFPDGSLDIENSVLKKLDFVGAAIHSHFNLSKKDQTDRLKKAMDNQNIDVIFHPTGRIINSRPPYEIDIKEILNQAKNTNTVLEINASPNRLDLKDEYIKMANDGKIMLSIDSDAHNIYHFNYLEFGIAQARRGWTEKKDIINTKPLKEFMEFIKKTKNKR